MAKIQISSHIADCLSAFHRQAEVALESCGLLAEGYAKLNCPVDTGALRNSINHKVVMSNEQACYIGTNMEYAPYVELGTGKHYPGGRQSPWYYEDAKGEWHKTNGMKAHPYLKPAVDEHRDEYKQVISDTLRS